MFFSDQNINKRIVNYSLILSCFYLVVRIIDNVILQMNSLGDEWFFIRDLSFYLDNGYYLSVLNGFSIPITILSSWIFNFTGDLSLSLRLSNTFSNFILIIYLFYRKDLVKNDFKKIFTIFLFMLIGTMGGMFTGTNDSIFNASLVIIFSEIYLHIRKSKSNNIIMVIAFTSCILSRPHFIIYLPMVFLSLVILYVIRNGWIVKNIFSSISINFFTSIILVVLFNYPKIIESNFKHNQGNYLPEFLFFTYSDKSGTYKTNDPGFNWTQWHFYSQMVSNQSGNYLFAPVVEWNEVQEFKEKNTDYSLPSSYQEYLQNHPLSVIKRFPFSIIEISLMSIRHLGLFLFMIPAWLYYKINNKAFDSSIFISILILSTIFIWALIWPRYIDNRWLVSIYIMVLIMVTNKNNFVPHILEKKHLMLNIIIMDFITVWALWKWKIFLHI